MSTFAGSGTTGTSLPLADRTRAALERLGIAPPADLPRFVWIELPRRRWLLMTDALVLIGDWTTGAVIQIGGGR